MIKTKRKSIIFSTLANNYFEYIKIHNKSYKQQLLKYNKHILPYCGKLTVEEITPQLIEKIQRDKIKHLSPKTVNDIIQMLATIFNHAINTEVIRTTNPTKRIKKLSINNQRLRYLSIEEVKELFDILKDNHQLYLFTKLALNTGARLHTLTQLKKKILI